MSDSRPQNIIDLVSPDQQIRGHDELIDRDRGSEALSTPSVKLGRCRIARHGQMMLAIRLCSGEVEVLPYAALSRIRSSDTDTSLRLSFCVGDIIIEGQNLTILYHYLCEHRVQEVCQSDRAECMANCDELCIHSVSMQLRE